MSQRENETQVPVEDGRAQFLWMRSVQISAFEAQTEEEDERLWAEAQRAADLLFGPAA